MKLQIKLLILITMLIVPISSQVFAQDGDDPMADWETYANNEFDFSMRYPEAWEVEESENWVQFIQGDVQLTVAFKAYEDKVEGFFGGVSAGEFQSSDPIQLLDQDIPKDYLVFEENITAVFYGFIDVQDFILAIRLDDAQGGALSDEVIAQVDLMISSFALESGETPIIFAQSIAGDPDPRDEWETYFSQTHPFGFRYPNTWTLEETENAILLRQETYLLYIGYRAEGETTMLGGSGLAAGEILDREPIEAMFQTVNSTQLVLNNQVLAVFYPTAGGIIQAQGLEFYIQVDDLNPDFSLAGLPESVITEVDMIVESFKTIPPQEYLDGMMESE